MSRLGADFMEVLQQTQRLTKAVEQLNLNQDQLRLKIELINDRIINVENRLDQTSSKRRKR